MEKIYHEINEKSGHHDTNSPCVSVIAFRPRGDKEGELPAIIILQNGSVRSGGYLVMNHTKYITEDWNHNGAQLIRKAIKLFDAFKRKVYAETKGG